MEDPRHESGEAIPFREWMRRALFDPERGYYSRNVRTVGRRGDFSTSATVGTALGGAIASWLKEELSVAGNVRTVIEAGGGDGSLMREVLRATGFAWRWRVKFFMVESSPVLTDRQKAQPGASRARWFTDMKDALDACGGRAMIFHNELLDAFPVTPVGWGPEAPEWREVWLARDGARWVEELRPLAMSDDDRAAFSVLGWRPAQPQRCELGTGAREWLRDWSPHWREGAMLTVDYGDVFPQIYHRRPRGTLRAYHAHQALTGDAVFANMGRQDITADVNFTDLVRWGVASGWKPGPVETQRDFLRKHLARADERAAVDPGLRFLMEDHGAGGAFRVLVLRAGA
jgi:SAM-dependent MidA family methyltransferase